LLGKKEVFPIVLVLLELRNINKSKKKIYHQMSEDSIAEDWMAKEITLEAGIYYF
jgi:hypothetical protein